MFRGDGFKIGMDIENSPLNTMAGAFIVFRGSQLHPNEVNRYALIEGRRWFNQTMEVNGILKGRTNFNQGQEVEKTRYEDLPDGW